MNILRANMDADNTCTMSIHDLGYPLTPNSINPAIADFNELKTLLQLSDFERLSSRVFKFYII
jgi:hypothetical protein